MDIKEIKRERGSYVCPYNGECRCIRLECKSCGWNPEVAKARMDKFMTKMGTRP